jgi:hypothetical protein
MALNNRNKKIDDLIFPKFDDIKVSTKTFVVSTNMLLDLQKLFDFIKITPYNFTVKKRGRKKKNDTVEQVNIIEDGSIVTVKFEKQIKGIDLKMKKGVSKKKKGKWFRNSLTIVLMLKNKPTNIKVYKNGVFQITGCKIDSNAEECIKYIWNIIKDTDIYEFIRGDNIDCFYIPAMRNMDFSLGFIIDREKLAKYMSMQTDFHSLLETSFGYTGVNIKIPIEESITTLGIKKTSYINNEWISVDTTYQEYLDLLPKKEVEKKLKKKRFSTFLCFHSGKIIQSSITENTARKPYDYFLQIIRKCYDQIEERLDY